jgi:hypothetical protein
MSIIDNLKFKNQNGKFSNDLLFYFLCPPGLVIFPPAGGGRQNDQNNKLKTAEPLVLGNFQPIQAGPPYFIQGRHI